MPAALGSGSVPANSTRTFFLRAKISSASGVASGAITTSRKSLASSSAVFPSSVVLTATMPPKIDTGSHS
ncbi:hypothetical protein D3C86_2243460 [compost metagenome]